MLLADKAYGSVAIRSFIVPLRGWANIPPRHNEREIRSVSACTSIGTETFAFVKLAAIRLWLRVYESAD